MSSMSRQYECSKIMLSVHVLFGCLSLAHCSGKDLHRFEFNSEYYENPSGVFNPSAIWSPTLGWVMTFRWDRCFYKECGVHQTDTRALVSFLGMDYNAPDMDAAIPNATEWSFNDKRMKELMRRNSAATGSIGDLRLFMWKGEIFASHWIKFGFTGGRVPKLHKCWNGVSQDRASCEYTVISRMNMAARTFDTVYQFQVPILGTTYRQEKNWAFLESKSHLTLIYSLLPCTTIYEFNPISSRGAALRKGLCFDQQEQIHKITGLWLKESRLSGHPVSWQPRGVAEQFFLKSNLPSPPSPQELLALVHTWTPEKGYCNWALRLHPESLVATHISMGPVIQAQDYSHLDGYLDGALIVGSFHILAGKDGRQVLRLFLGVGDRYSAWEDLSIDDIMWHALQPPHVFTDENKVLSFLETS